MKGYEAIKLAIEEGKKVKRSSWDKPIYYKNGEFYKGGQIFKTEIQELAKEDWKVVEEPKGYNSDALSVWVPKNYSKRDCYAIKVKELDIIINVFKDNQPKSYQKIKKAIEAGTIKK